MLDAIAIIAVVLAIAIAVVLILAATKPNISVSSARRGQRTAGKDFALINDFRQWGGWSPYEHKDPAMKRTFSGPKVAGRGLCMEGRQECRYRANGNTRGLAPSKIVIKLDFYTPFEAHNMAEFTMLPQDDATNVTWRMHGPAPFMARIMHVFINIDKMVGKDFEAGLANLKQLTEK